MPPPTEWVAALMDAYRRGDPLADQKPQERANVEALQRAYRAFMARDLDGLLASIAEDVDWHVAGPEDVPFTGLRSHAQLAEHFRKAFEMLEHQEIQVRDVVAQGDTVTVAAFERGKILPTGAPYAMSWVQIFTFRDGKVVRFHEHMDTAALRDATRQDKPG